MNPRIRRYWLLTAYATFVVEPSLGAQGVAEDDSGRCNHSKLANHVEGGLNALGAGVEYRYQWFPFFSTDVVASLSEPGIAAGITFSPVWFFFVQGVFGEGEYDDGVTLDGPPAFKPSYLYGWNAGFHVPVLPTKTRLYFILSFGQLKYVQDHYNYNGGGFLVGPQPELLYRTERRTAEVVSVGVGISF